MQRNRSRIGELSAAVDNVTGAVDPTDAGGIPIAVAYRSGQRPDPCYRLVLLNAVAHASRTEFRAAIEAVENMLQSLKEGYVRDLAGQPHDKAVASAEQFQELRHLVAFGRRLFDNALHHPPLTYAQRPAHLAYLPAVGPFPSLQWEEGVDGTNRGEADVALQLTASRVAAVNCAAVEVWKLIVDEHLPLDIVGTFDGFVRHDGRGWLDFHDGVSNMHSSQRQAAIEAPGDPPWMGGGTYMAFLRLTVNLATWRRLSRAQQELLVGRDKLSGAGLIGTGRDSSGRVVPVASPALDADADDRGRSDFLDPPQTVDPIVEASHVHRANQLRGSPLAAAALRIFRQGYEFLETIEGTPRLGLNFVSFQRDLSVINQLLHLRGWLGDANFGGRSAHTEGEPPAVQLLRVACGGFYAVPPTTSSLAELFT